NDGRAMDRRSGVAGVDRDHVVTLAHQKGEDAVRRARRIGRGADDRDAAWPAQKLADLAFVVDRHHLPFRAFSQSATRAAIAWNGSPAGSVPAAGGTPPSLARRMPIDSGTRPRKSSPIVAAAASAPP